MFDAEGLNILICGHTHIPYVRQLDGQYLINAGSVGKPKDDDPRAGYVLITLGEDIVEPVIRRVEYDAEKAARAVEAAGLPGDFADMLRQGRG